MLRLKVPKVRLSEDFVALPSSSRLMPAKHLLAISVIAASSVLLAVNSSTISSLFSSSADPVYMSEAERAYLMAAEPAEVLVEESAGSENYEDYDIPLSYFAKPKSGTAGSAAQKIIDAKNTLPQVVSMPRDRMADLVSITPLKERPELNAKGHDSDLGALNAQNTAAVNPDNTLKAQAAAQNSSEDEAHQAAAPALPHPAGVWYAHRTGSGDNLSRIFNKLALPQAVLSKIIAACSDQKYLSLAVGDEVHFLIGSKNELLALVKPAAGKQAHFARESADDGFLFALEDAGTHASKEDLAAIKEASKMPSAVEAQKLRAQAAEEKLMAAKERQQGGTADPTRPRLIIAEVNAKENFDKAGRRAGLTSTEIASIKQQTKGRFDLSSLKAGDSFRVLFNGIGTRALINAVEFNQDGRKFAIYRNPEDKGYYQEGEYVPTAGIFRRFPLADSIKINSKFNPTRRHPVTGRISPHKGVDFKAPIGTPVYAPADGTVAFAGYQRAAGYYIIINHASNYSTVYMHLSKMDVKKGQQVVVGQQIARTGNTGRTTGPHLHYEVHVGDQAVDPLRIKLPSNSHPHLAREQREAFESNIMIYKTELYTEKLAQR